MEYKVKCDIKATDLWKLTMNRTYHTLAGVVNIVFTVAMMLLTFRFFATVGTLLRVLLIVACAWFPLVHPLLIYGQSAKQVEGVPKDVELTFKPDCVFVTAGGKSEKIEWSKIRVINRTDMVIVMSDATHGYMLTDRMLGEKRTEILDYLRTKTGSGK